MRSVKLLIVLAKELTEIIVRQTRVFFIKNRSEYIEQLCNDGFSVEPNFYSPEECEQLRDKIDRLIEDENVNTWVDDTGSDHRIYFANDLDEEFDKFYSNQKIRNVLASYTGTTKPQGMLLAARIDAKAGNLGSGGGWHRDSPISHQFKAVCYLSNVNEENGPFQFIRGSHKKLDVIRSYFSGIFSAGQYRFSEDEVSHYLKHTGRKITNFVAPEGTLAFADTKGIHRGKPIKNGSRYVLFCYFWHNGIPQHFAKLKQNNKR